ncbi:MAG: hypothetical protein M0017_06955 [Desulfobacteraceae bacterium]|nr:hypothetical protein [Desulfobacteraceae bacterium]
MPSLPKKLLLLPLLAVFPFFFTSWGQAPASPLSQLDNLAHLGWFGLLAWGLALLPRAARRPPPLQLGIVLIVVLAVGGAIELIQPRFGRTASWADLGLDLVGGLLGLLFLAPVRRELDRRLLAGGRIAAIALAALGNASPALTLWDMSQAARSFPVLGDFESRLEADRWTAGTIDRTLARHGSGSLRVTLGTEPYSGTALTRCFGDWRGYSAFVLSIHNPGPGALRITLSIRDQAHERRGGRYRDRFNRAFRLVPGWNDLRIPISEIEQAPAGRKLDLSRLTQVVIFAEKLEAPRVIHLDDIRLVP